MTEPRLDNTIESNQQQFPAIRTKLRVFRSIDHITHRKSRFFQMHEKKTDESRVPRILKWYREREEQRQRGEDVVSATQRSALTLAQIRMGARTGTATSRSRTDINHSPGSSDADDTSPTRKRKNLHDSSTSGQHFRSLFAKSRTNSMHEADHWKITQSFLPKQALELVQQVMKKSPTVQPVEQQLKGCLCFIDISGYSSMCALLTQRATNSQADLLHHVNKDASTLAKGTPTLSRADSHTIVEMSGISSSVEEVARNVNKYFANLMQVIRQCGGDVVKNGGDSLVCLFNDTKKVSMGELCLRAIICALSIQQKMPVYEADGIQLKLHIGISCGTFVSALVGGVDDSFEYVLLGQEVFRSLYPAVNCSKDSEVAVTEHCLNELALLVNHPALDHLTFTPIEGTDEVRLVSWDKRASLPLQEIVSNLRIQPQNWIPTVKLCDELKKLLPRSVCDNIENNQTEFMADVRRISAVFINLCDCIPQVDSAEFDTELREPTLALKLQQCMEPIQRILKQFDGVISQVLQDEKGLFILGGFGIPPFFSKYDASRAVTASMNIHHALKALNVSHSIGIATGLTYCGSLGDSRRQIVSIISHRVNLASRLMGHPKNHYIFVDEATKVLSEEAVEYVEEVLSLKFKGIEQNLPVYMPTDKVSYNLDANSARGGNAFFKQYNKQRKIFNDLLAGRQKLIDRLKGVITAKKESSSTPIVLCKGSSGSGKTEILLSTLKSGKSLGFTPLYSHAVNIHIQTPFFIWKQLLSQIIHDYVHNDSPDSVHDDFIKHCVQLLRNKIEQGFTYLVVVRSIHFVDEWSLRLILECIAQFQNRMVFVASSRNKMRDASVPLQQIVDMAEDFLIPKLTDGETQRIVCSICQCTQVDPQIVRMVNEKSNSNVLFVEEIVLNFLHTNIISVVDGVCRVVDEKAFRKFVTPKLMDLLGSRFERMHVNLQLVCKVASCLAVDTSVRVSMLKDLFPVKQMADQIDDFIQQLIAQNFIELRSSSAIIIFKEEAYKLLPYHRMLNIRKRQLHKAAAKWLQKNPDLVPLKDTISAEIVFHMLRAIENGDKADALLQHAVDHSMKESKELEEMGRYDAALESLRSILTAISQIPSVDERQVEQFTTLVNTSMTRLRGIMEASAILGVEHVDAKDFLPK